MSLKLHVCIVCTRVVYVPRTGGMVGITLHAYPTLDSSFRVCGDNLLCMRQGAANVVVEIRDHIVHVSEVGMRLTSSGDNCWQVSLVSYFSQIHIAICLRDLSPRQNLRIVLSPMPHFCASASRGMRPLLIPS